MKFFTVLFALVCAMLFVGASAGAIDLQLEPGESAAIAGALAVFGQIALRIIMKKAKVKKQSVIGKIVWALAEAFLGDGVVIANNPDKEDVAKRLENKSPVLKEAAEFLRR
jgi:hypothetical protein